MSTLGAVWTTGSRCRWVCAAASLLAIGVFALSAHAAGDDHDHGHGSHDGHGHAAAGEHGQAAADGDHGGSHGINWFYGLLGEKPDLDHPTFAWRTKGMPPPLAANLFNAGLLFFLLYRFGKKPIAEALVARRERIMRGMDEAGKMKAQAAEQLASYQSKLDKIDADVARIKRQTQDAAKAEREQILTDAKARRERMERETTLLIEQELKAAQQEIHQQTVRSAMSRARELLAAHVTGADHDRLSEEYLGQLAERPVVTSGGPS